MVLQGEKKKKNLKIRVQAYIGNLWITVTERLKDGRGWIQACQEEGMLKNITKHWTRIRFTFSVKKGIE